jgi:hypothetical protein
MAGMVANFSSALEDCLNAIGQGESLGDCLARHPKYSEKLRPYLERVVQMRESSESERQSYDDIPTDIPFKVALTHSIQMIMRGKTPEYCYTQYPEHAAELKPWLTTVLDVRENGATGSVRTLEFPSELLIPQVTFKEALEYCLKALDRGIQPEVVLSRYPYYADRLRIWVYYVASLGSRIDLKPAHQYQATPTMAAPQVAFTKINGYSRSFSNFALSLVFAIVFFLSCTGLVQASAGALPGDSLYFVKRGVEDLRFTLASPEAQDYLLVSYASERYNEILAAIEKDGQVDVVIKVRVSDVQSDKVVVSNFWNIYFQPGYKMPGVKAGEVVEIQVHADQQHGMSTNQVTPSTTTPAAIPTSVVALVATPTIFTSPTPTQVLASPTATFIHPTVTFEPTDSPILVFTSTPTSLPTDEPTVTATVTPVPTSTATLVPTDTRVPTNTPAPTDTLVPTGTPLPTDTLVPTDTPAPTDTPVPADTPTDLPIVVPTSTPDVDIIPIP